MDRDDFKVLAHERLDEAKALLAAGHPSGAYYLAGYAVECALKACIAKRTRQYDFPDKKRTDNSYTHDLVKLLGEADLSNDHAEAARRDPVFKEYWGIVKDWSEQSRYELWLEVQANSLLRAIDDPLHGVMQWLSRHY